MYIFARSSYFTESPAAITSKSGDYNMRLQYPIELALEREFQLSKLRSSTKEHPPLNFKSQNRKYFSSVN